MATESLDTGGARSFIETPLQRAHTDELTPAPVVLKKDPGAPTLEEREQHYATHLPYRSWCPVCVKAAGKEDGHFSVKDKEPGEKPIIALDYKSFGQEAHVEDKCTTIVGRDKWTKTTFPHIAESKGCSDGWATQQLIADISGLG